MDIDLNADISNMANDELLEHQQSLTRARLEILERARQVQATLDYRAAEIVARRRLEDEQLGQLTKPQTQHVFGETVSSGDVDDLGAVMRDG